MYDEDEWEDHDEIASIMEGNGDVADYGLRGLYGSDDVGLNNENIEDYQRPTRGRGRPSKPAVACKTPGCSRDAKSKGLCWRCYKRRSRSVQE